MMNKWFVFLLCWGMVAVADAIPASVIDTNVPARGSQAEKSVWAPSSEYDQAVLTAILPCVSDFCERMHLNAATPITVQQVREFHSSSDDVGGSLILTNGYHFVFWRGHVSYFCSPGSYFTLQDPNLIHYFQGRAKIGRLESVELARNALRDLGYSEESLYAQLEPEITESGNSMIPFYRITWLKPHNGTPSVIIEVDASRRRVVAAEFHNWNLVRKPPQISGKFELLPPTRGDRFLKPLADSEVNGFYTSISSHVVGWATNLSLPITANWTNEVEKKLLSKNRDGICGTVWLTNGFILRFEYGAMIGFESPGCFFVRAGEVSVSKYVGRIRLSESKIVKLARASVRKLGFSENGFSLEKKPSVENPHAKGITIPRCELRWEDIRGGVLRSRAIIEIDSDHGVVTKMELLNEEVVSHSTLKKVDENSANSRDLPAEKRANKAAVRQSQEALKRKARSMAILKREGAPISKTLPPIVDSAHAKRRTKEEIAKRAIALFIIASKADGQKEALAIDKLIQVYQADSFFTPREAAFIKNPNPSDKEAAPLSWRYEDCWVLLWVLGYVDELKTPEDQCDLEKEIAFFSTRTTEEVVRDAKLRDPSKILDQADLIYRYHWASTEARKKEHPFSGKLNEFVVYEQHCVFNWLIGYKDKDWDDISSQGGSDEIDFVDP